MAESPQPPYILIGIDLQRRPHWQAACHYLASHRDDTYKDLKIPELIPLGFHASRTSLQSIQDTSVLVRAVAARYWADPAVDLFADWQRYCKALTSADRVIATFEGAVYFATEYIPLYLRETWHSLAQDRLQLLKLLLASNEQKGFGRKRQRELIESSRQEADDLALTRFTENPHWTTYADVSQLRGFLGWVLFIGVKGSYRREQELSRSQRSVTDAVRWHFPPKRGRDQELHVFVSADVGEEIAKAKNESLNDLKAVLGEWLFGAMESSEWRRTEVKEGLSLRTEAVRITPQERDDWVITIRLGWEVGLALWAVYPLYP